MSLRLRLLAACLRVAARPVVAHVSDPPRMRRAFRRGARLIFRAPPNALCLPLNYHAATGPAPALMVACGRPHPRRIILYFHGGAYLCGGPETHAALAARIARLTQLRVFLPAYALAPEHPAPAAFEDARAAWAHLLAAGHRPRDIVLAGDSAGGGLALALLARLCAEGTPPRACIAFSPFTDADFAGDSLRENAARDALLPARRAPQLRDMIRGACDPADPRLSPLHAEFPGCPPLLMQVSDAEILRDDTLRLAEKLRRAGAPVRVGMWHGAPHVWQLFDGYVPEARAALAQAAAFVSEAYDGALAAPDQPSAAPGTR